MFRIRKDKSSPGGVPQLETKISSPGKRYRAKALTKEEVGGRVPCGFVVRGWVVVCLFC